MSTTQHLVLTIRHRFGFLLRLGCWGCWLFFGCCYSCPCRAAVAMRLLLVLLCSYDAACRVGGDFIVAVVLF
jgi:hypothetical protein